MLKRLLTLTLIGCMVVTLAACNKSSSSENQSSNSHEDSETEEGSTEGNEEGNTEGNEDVSEEGVTKTSSLLRDVADPDQAYGTTFGQGDIIDINIEMDEEEWNDLLKNAIEEEYHSANITVNGTTVENVGVRTKGFSSLTSVANSDSERYGFKVKFDEYVEEQTLNGLDMMVLNANFSDPSYMRELLTYAATAYLDGLAPYMSYCRLSVNGELYGLYLSVESYDDSFGQRNSSSTDTVLYKAVSENCTLLPNDDASGFDVDYGKDEDFSNIKELIQVLNNTIEDNKEELEAILDIDSVLKAIAVNTVFGNYDSYSGSKAHNYYLLFTEGKFSYIGWDYNMSLGGFSEDGGASVTVDITSPVYNVDISERPLIQKLLAIDEYYQQYLGYIDSLSTRFADFTNIVDGIADIIRTDVEKDPTAFYTLEQFETNIIESNTDLTKVENNFGKMGGRHGDGQGGRPDASGYSFPEGTDKTEWPNMNQQMPYGSDDTENTPPQMPNGSDDTENNSPQMPNGYMNKPGGMGNMISQDTVSIVDYFNQRLDQINSMNN